MNIFKFGRGDFFGIIVPGAFLVLNLIFLFPCQAQALGGQIPAEWGSEGIGIILALLVISYLFGFALRLIKPPHLEKVAFYLYLYERKARRAAKGEHLGPNKSLQEVREVFREPFPYMHWFYTYYLGYVANSYTDFFKIFREREFGGNTKRMTQDMTFINQCKLYVLEHSKALRDELLFCEGVTRFVSGMAYALALGTAAIPVAVILRVQASVALLVLPIYVAVALLFVYKLRFVRVKEVATILSAFAFVKKEPLDRLLPTSNPPPAPSTPRHVKAHKKATQKRRGSRPP